MGRLNWLNTFCNTKKNGICPHKAIFELPVGHVRTIWTQIPLRVVSLMNQAITIVTDSLILNLADTDFQPINTDILTQGGNCVVDLEYFVLICR